MTEFATVSNVDCRFGAPMGRAGAHAGDDPHCRIKVKLVRIDSGGYDDGGAYWGLGTPLWQATGVDEFEGERAEIVDYMRAPSKGAAVAAWAEEWPNAIVE